MSVERSPAVLFCAFAPVPGAFASSHRLLPWLSILGEPCSIDALVLRNDDQAHIQRIGRARVMRVPSSGKSFLEALTSYQRALGRQIEAENYALIVCGDWWSAHVAISLQSKSKANFQVIVDCQEVSSIEWAKNRYSQRIGVAGEIDIQTAENWHKADEKVLQRSTYILVPTRPMARLLAQRVDARRIVVVPHTVDTGVFGAVAPSTAKTTHITLMAADTTAFSSASSATNAAALAASLVRVAFVCTQHLTLRRAKVTVIAHDEKMLRLMQEAWKARLSADDLKRIAEKAAEKSSDKNKNNDDKRTDKIADKNAITDKNDGKSGKDEEHAPAYERIRLKVAGSARHRAHRLGKSHTVVVWSGLREDTHTPQPIPHVALEAMASGRPVILAAHETSIQDVVQHGRHLWCVRPDSDDALADAVALLVHQTALRDAIAQTGRAYASRSASWEMARTEWLTLIGDLLRVVVVPHRAEAHLGAEPPPTSMASVTGIDLDDDMNASVVDGAPIVSARDASFARASLPPLISVLAAEPIVDEPSKNPASQKRSIQTMARSFLGSLVDHDEGSETHAASKPYNDNESGIFASSPHTPVAVSSLSSSERADAFDVDLASIADQAPVDILAPTNDAGGAFFMERIEPAETARHITQPLRAERDSKEDSVFTQKHIPASRASSEYSWSSSVGNFSNSAQIAKNTARHSTKIPSELSTGTGMVPLPIQMPSLDILQHDEGMGRADTDDHWAPDTVAEATPIDERSDKSERNMRSDRSARNGKRPPRRDRSERSDRSEKQKGLSLPSQDDKKGLAQADEQTIANPPSIRER